MTALPPKAELDGSSGGHNQGVFKAAIGGVRDFLSGLFGTSGNVSDALAGLKLTDPEAQFNLAPSFAVAANALTATLKDAANTNLGATNPGFIAQRSATLTDGAVTLRQLAANVALTVSAGSTLGLASATPGWLHWYLIDNAGAQELAVSGSFFGFTGRTTTVAEGGAGAADSGTVMYSATLRSNVAFRWIAASKGQHTSGNWTAVPTEIRRGPALPVEELLEDTAPDLSADFLITFDTSTGTFRKAKPSSLGGSLPIEYLYGFQMANNATDATNDIDIGTGQCRDAENSENIALTSTLIKQLDAAWAVGNNAGMRDTGSIANGTWHLHAIKRLDTGVVDVIASLSPDTSSQVTMTIASPCVLTWNDHGLPNGASFKLATTGALPTGLTAGTTYFVINGAANTFQLAATQGGAAINTSGGQSGVHTCQATPVMPANYTKFRRIGSILRESAAIVGFVQDGDYFRRKASVLDVNATNPGTSAVTAALSVPQGVNVQAFGNAQIFDSGAAVLTTMHISDLGANDEAPSNSAAPLGMASNTSSVIGGFGTFNCRTNRNKQLRYRALASSATATVRIATMGWYDTRGKQ